MKRLLSRSRLSWWQLVCVAALVALHGWLALSATLKKSATFDEPLHITAGTSYWLRNDFRLQPENGNLPQRLIGLPVALSDFKLPPESRDAWAKSEGYYIANEFIFGSGDVRDGILLRARAANIVLSCLLALGVFAFSLRLWGPGGAFLSLTVYTLSPTILAHAGLATSDVAAAAAFLATLTVTAALIRAVTPLRVSFLGLAGGALALSKYSAVLAGPVIVAAVLWRSVERRPLPLWSRGGVRRVRARLRRFVWLSGGVVVAVLIAWGAIWAAYGFRYSANNPAAGEFTAFFKPKADLALANQRTDDAINFMERARLFPESFLYGFRFVLRHAEARSAYFMGEWSASGWRMFFPIAFLIKTPLGTLLLIASGLIACVAATLRGRLSQVMQSHKTATVLILVAFVTIYATAAITSSLNIGHRHLLPIYPVVFVLLGALLYRRLPFHGVRATLSIAGLALLAFESFAIRPHYLAFFNASIGGASEGHRYFVDSSLDWGQDLPGLREWLSENGLLSNPREPVFLSYFGTGNPASYGISAYFLPTYIDLRRSPWIPELTGGVYAISVTMFEGMYTPWAGRWTPAKENRYQQIREKLRNPDGTPVRKSGVSPDVVYDWELARFARLCLYLRTVEPDTVIGHSINIFRLSDSQVHLAVDGSLDELVADIESRTGVKLE